MDKIMRRLHRGERYWPAEIVLRSFGLLLLGLCALASHWLYRLVHMPPPHQARPVEFAAAAAAFFGWSLGCAFLVEGPGLFRRIHVPGRYRRILL